MYGPTAKPRFDAHIAHDGEVFIVGDVSITALHTPGHRPEHTAFALIDTARGPEPWAVLTGDTLFVGDIARPDLAVDKAEGARGIFHSLHDKLLKLIKSVRNECVDIKVIPDLVQYATIKAALEDLDGVYAHIAEELRAQYTLGYVSSNPKRDGRWRRVVVQLAAAARDLLVRHREGYQAPQR